jgi:hypothetical protein
MIGELLAYTFFVLGVLALAYVTSEIILDNFDIPDSVDDITILTLSTLFYVVVIFLIFHFGV